MATLSGPPPTRPSAVRSAGRFATCPAARRWLLGPAGNRHGAAGVRLGFSGRSRSGVRPGPRSPEGPPGAAVTTRRAPAPPPQRGRSGPGGGLGAPRLLRARGSCGKHRAGAAGVHGVCCRLFYKASRRCSATERSRKRENVFV